MMAAAGIASTGIVLEVLTKDNYENWSSLVENYLVGQGLWHDVVVGDSELYLCDPKWVSNNSNSNLISKNGQALHAIQLACGSETLRMIRQFKTARDAWNHLKVSFSEDVEAYPDLEQGHESRDNIYKLHNDVKRGYWNDVKSYLDRFPDDIFYSLPSTGRTVLHVAVAAGQGEIVKELVRIGGVRLLKMQDKKGYTAFALVAELTDNKEMAEWMVCKGGQELLCMKTKDKDDEDGKGEIPLLLASAKGHKRMTRYLFSETPCSVVLENKDSYGPNLLAQCISAQIFDVAAALLQHRVGPKLPLYHKSDYVRPPLYELAHMPSAFPSGYKRGNFFNGLIYKFLRLQTSIDFKSRDNEIVYHVKPEKRPDANTLTGKIRRLVSISVAVKRLVSCLGQCSGQFQQCLQNSVFLIFPGIKRIYDMKMNHYLVLEILRCFHKRISRLTRESELCECSAYDAILQAAKSGIIEFIDSMRRANPNLLWAIDKNKRGIFSHAILNRQEKVFQLIHEIQGQQEIIASHVDVFGNNLLHLAAELGPSAYLSLISNSALQMQRELQWFEAVKSIVLPKCEEDRNKDGKKPSELFTKTHEELVKAGEKWAKDTAGSFTLVGTLIVTVMFAAAFTVPGGNNQETGVPIFLDKDAFTVFIIADALSLITSSSSVLLFIGILTSRYAEEDFRMRLPRNLLLGLITLSISLVSMMVAFCATLAMMLKGYHRLIIAAILLAIIPLSVLVPTQLRLSCELFNSTMRFNFLTAKKKKVQDY